MSDQAVAWLRDQVQARKATAEALLDPEWGDRPWAVEKCSEHDCPCIVYQGEYKPFDEAQVPPIQYIADAEAPEFAAHIALNDPRDVIARCEAELAILDLHEGRISDYGGHDFRKGEPSCTACGADDGWYGVAWPCPTLRLLAGAYRHREGYGEHWGELVSQDAP